MGRSIISKKKTTEIFYTDETIKKEEVTRNKFNEIVDRKLTLTQNKLTRVRSNERKIKNSIVSKEYVYDDGTKLIQIQEFRYTPKKQEKRLENEYVVTVKGS